MAWKVSIMVILYGISVVFIHSAMEETGGEEGRDYIMFVSFSGLY